MKEHGLPPDYPGPIVVSIEDPSCFPASQAPIAGCAFWLVSHPAKMFAFNTEQPPDHNPESVSELAEAILSCTVDPEEYRKLYERTAQAARARAETVDNPEEKSRLLKMAEARMPQEDVASTSAAWCTTTPEHSAQ